MNPVTTILIPNFDGLAHLPECLSSLLAQTEENFQIIIIDDGSSDGSVSFVKKDFPLVGILVLEENVGFAKAVNLGIEYAIRKYQPTYIAILNNDTKTDKNWLKELIRAIESEKNIAAVASNMLFYDRPDTINSQGGKFTFNGWGLDINFNKKIAKIKKYPRFVLASCWGATLIKSEAIKNIGLLDEDYYSYFEDLDWGYRTNLYGYKIIFNPDAIVYHKYGASWRNHKFKKLYLCRKNSLRTIIKNYELKNILKVFPLILFDYFICFPAACLINRKIENGRLTTLFEEKYPFSKRFKFLAIPLAASFWNIKNLSQTLELRKKIQQKRTISDRVIFKLNRF